jgi:hypothetical protein
MVETLNSKLKRNLTVDDEAFLRRFVIPEEDRPLFTSVTWSQTGGYRWFRSPKVVCIEHYRGASKAKA